MSNLKVASINHPSASSGGLAIGTDGNVSGAGMDLIVSQSFTAASTVSIDNCFTSTYDNYRILARVTTGSAAELHMRLRASGANDSTAGNYKRVSYNSIGGLSTSVTSDALWYVNATSVATTSHYVMDVLSPAEAVMTTAWIQARYLAAAEYATFMAGRHIASTAFDGFAIYPASGTITGTLRVYGYRN